MMKLSNMKKMLKKTLILMIIRTTQEIEMNLLNSLPNLFKVFQKLNNKEVEEEKKFNKIIRIPMSLKAANLPLLIPNRANRRQIDNHQHLQSTKKSWIILFKINLKSINSLNLKDQELILLAIMKKLIKESKILILRKEKLFLKFLKMIKNGN